MSTIKLQHIFHSARLKSTLQQAGRRPLARLQALMSVLGAWLQAPETAMQAQAAVAGLDNDDIAALRMLIAEQLSRGRYSNAAMLTEQILFIVIGALRTQMQNNVSDSWQLSLQTIESLLDDAHRPWVSRQLRHAYAFILGAIMLWGGHGMVTYANSTSSASFAAASMPTHSYATSQSPYAYVPTHLYSFHKIMQNASCQYPQAAMLPVEQRAIFLDFVNKGDVALSQINHLQTAVSKVECFYASSINDSTIH